jgi:beta-aspartyl-dipeptidase (metallo-type)
MILIKNAEVYTPEYIGENDVLFAGGKIISIKASIDESSLKQFEPQIINAKGLKLIPGIIDPHVHISGAGGEGGPATRTSEIELSELIEGGVTTVIGCLGTDGITRDVRSVLMKVKGLREEGLSSWMYTGSYQVPPPSITGDYAKDIAMIEEVIGLGEIALSDHRSSHPSTSELIKLVEHARVAGMLGGKAGIVNIHMGDASKPFDPIIQAVENSELPYTQFYPTHCNRNKDIFEDAKKYGKHGYLDITSSSYPFFPDEEIKPSIAIRDFIEAGVPVEHITMSSDANGSLPEFDKAGNLIQLKKGKPSANLKEIKDAVCNEKVSMETALKIVTSNVADILKLKRKGRIKEDNDADAILLDKEFQIKYLFAKEDLFIEDYKIQKKGNFE